MRMQCFFIVAKKRTCYNTNGLHLVQCALLLFILEQKTNIKKWWLLCKNELMAKKTKASEIKGKCYGCGYFLTDKHWVICSKNLYFVLIHQQTLLFSVCLFQTARLISHVSPCQSTVSDKDSTQHAVACENYMYLTRHLVSYSFSFLTN